MKSTLLKWLSMMKNKILLLFGIVLLSSCGCSGEKKHGPSQPVSFQRFADGVTIRSEVLGLDVSMAVLLPAPTLPTRTTFSPLFMLKDTSSSAVMTLPVFCQNNSCRIL